MLTGRSGERNIIKNCYKNVTAKTKEFESIKKYDQTLKLMIKLLWIAILHSVAEWEVGSP